ncbi:hypothetical protein [Pedosphaera parvula]|uniref:Uncharacterized protein n=1 Tax=Pedosphaera parvula (strain Ellin514) TaxID=320771 RepID=B9XLI1_PEDPL|nr:hypothetical protein [Pedosphaera parvula]EEF59229.1 conserved hypothetical protein [Pedosphaera parvula Ellin514]
MRLSQTFSIGALCALSLWGGATDASCASLGYGRQVILNRGLQIQSLAFITSTPAPPTNYSVWASANFTTFNSWNDANSEKTLGWTMPWSRWIKTDGSNPLTNNEKTQHPNDLVSLQYGDELNQHGTGTIDAATLSTMATNYATWHTQFGSNFLAYSNFGANNASKSMTAAGLASYMRATNPDMLMFDAYPRQYVTLSTWYAEMQKYRIAGLAGIDGTGQQPIPYAQYLDLYRTSYTASLPDESFVRLQEFASWAFGYTFVTAFVYNKPNNPTVYPALFASDGDNQPTVIFNEVAEANRQSLNLGPALIRLTSTDLRMIPGTGHSLPTGISAWAQGAGNNSYITSITPITTPGGNNSTSYGDVLIGYLEPLLTNNSAYPFADGTHFMIVNGASTGTAAGQSQWYHITFDFGTSGFDSLQLLSRDTGQIELIPLTHLTGSQYFLDWNLEGGTGDLFRFWNAHASPTAFYPPYLDTSGNLVVSGTNVTGTAGDTYSVLSSTNLDAPLTTWTTNTTGLFGAGGHFTNTIAPGASDTRRFFILKTP